MKTKLTAVFFAVLSCSAYSAQGSPGTMMYADAPNGQRVIVAATPERRGAQIWNAAVYSTPSGAVTVAETAQLPNPSGARVPATAKANIPAPAVAAAVGRVLAVTLKTLGPIGIGLAIYDLAKELGFTIGKSATGESTITMLDQTVCTVAPCPAFQQIAGGVTGAIVSSRLGACLDWAPKWSAQNSTYSLANVGYDSSQANSCKADVMTKSGALYYANNYYSGLIEVTVAPSPVVNTPATSQQLIDAVAAKSVWPVGSAIGRVIGEDLQPELHSPTSITVSGPSSSPGPVSRTVDNTNNTTNVQTTTYNHVYSGDTITTTTNITNITTNNSTGAVTNSTITTTTPATTPPPATPTTEPVYKSTDTPLAPQPKLYTPVYPRGIAGVWTDKKDELKSTPLNSLASSLMPNVGTGGSCPVMNVDLTFASWASFGVKDVAPPCYVWDWGKAIIILCSLLLARALIFGG